MSLLQILEIVFVRQRRIFIAVFLAALATVVGVTFALPREYRATATLLVGENRPISTGADAVELDEVLARTYTSLLEVSATKVKIVRAMPFPIDETKLTSDVSFEVIEGTHLIAIKATDESARRAQTIANVYARTFVRDQQRAAALASADRLRDLNAEIGRLAADIARMEGDPSPEVRARREQALNQLAAARASYSATQENISLQGNNLTVSSVATTPGSPAKPRPRLYIAVGTIFALILAALAALLRNLLDKRIRDEDELVDLLGVPVLSRIPMREATERSDRDIKEAVHFLRGSLRSALADKRNVSVAVTSALPGEGKTTVVAELAASIGAMGIDVIAVDCDLRRPMLERTFDVPKDTGLTNVLVGAIDTADALMPTQMPGVRVLGSGPIPPNPATLLDSGFGSVLRTVLSHADYVVLDTPPVMVGAETASVAAAADAVVLVVDLAISRRDAIVAARAQLERTGARLVGIVVNRMKVIPGSAYTYGYGYGDDMPVASDIPEPPSNGGRLRRRARQRT